MSGSSGFIKNKEVTYLPISENTEWFNSLPDKNWLALVIADKNEIPQLANVAKQCLDKNVLYVCGTGEAASEIDDEFDTEIVMRKIAENSDDYANTPMTIFNSRLDESLWDAVFTAVHETEAISKIVCINLTPVDLKSKLEELVTKMNAGWIPED